MLIRYKQQIEAHSQCRDNSFFVSKKKGIKILACDDYNIVSNPHVARLISCFISSNIPTKDYNKARFESNGNEPKDLIKFVLTQLKID